MYGAHIPPQADRDVGGRHGSTPPAHQYRPIPHHAGHQRIGAEIFDRCDTAMKLSRPVAIKCDVLGPESEYAPMAAHGQVQRLVGPGKHRAHWSVLERQKIHRRATNKTCDEQAVRPLIKLGGRSFCSIRPPRMRIMRSAMLMASV